MKKALISLASSKLFENIGANKQATQCISSEQQLSQTGDDQKKLKYDRRKVLKTNLWQNTALSSAVLVIT